MRNIILSFDDGLYDFKENAIPILDRYGFKASVNVITKYSELEEFKGYKYLSIKDLVEIKAKGFELACHTDTHQSKISVDDLATSKKKMIQYFGNEDYGLILPFSQKIDDSQANYILSNFLYLADYKTRRLSNTPFYHFAKIMAKITKSNKFLFYYCNYSYFYKHCAQVKYFKRLPVKSNISPKTYISFLKHMPRNATLVFMLHSITNDFESCPWPDGSWTVDNFDCLLRYLSKHKRKYKIVTQRSTLNE